MEGILIAKLGVSFYLPIIILLLVIGLLMNMVLKMNKELQRMKKRYQAFMRGNDGRTLEKKFKKEFDKIDRTVEIVEKNHRNIEKLQKDNKVPYQKLGLYKYDAFEDVEGKASFALTLLDGEDSGWILNSIHSKDGCYTYIKEILKGKSYSELSSEEEKSLEQAKMK